MASLPTTTLSATVFRKLRDYRPFAQLVADDDVAVTTGAFSTDANFLECVAVGTGYVESQLVAFSNYTPTTLAALTASANEYFLSLIASATLLELYKRRGHPELGQELRQLKYDLDWELAALAVGDRVFGS